MTTTAKVLTPQQEAILEKIREGKSVLYTAVAGSGKTFTLQQGAKIIKDQGLEVLFLAFQRDVADYLNTTMKPLGIQARTIHSLGLGAIHKAGYKLQKEPDNFKYQRLARRHVDLNFNFGYRQNAERESVREAVVRALRFGRENLIEQGDRQGLLDVIVAYNAFDYTDPMLLEAALNAYDAINEEGKRELITVGIYDFSDMVYFPVMMGLQPKQYDAVFLDEIQDFSLARIIFALRAVKPGGIVVGAGDRHQNIYRFAGALDDAYDEIKKLTGAIEMPLSVSMRCPRSHVELVKFLVPDMEAREGAPEGTILNTREDAPLDELIRGRENETMILSRFTAPLVRDCIDLLRKGIPVRMLGRSFDSDLTDILATVERAHGFDFNRVVYHIEEYRSRLIRYAMQREDGIAIAQNVNDRCDAIIVFIEEYAPKTMAELIGHINTLFNPERPRVRAGVIHRVKGLESRYIIVTHPESLPYIDHRLSPEAKTQEWNTTYVGLSRSTDTMIIRGEFNGDFKTRKMAYQSQINRDNGANGQEQNAPIVINTHPFTPLVMDVHRVGNDMNAVIATPAATSTDVLPSLPKPEGGDTVSPSPLREQPPTAASPLETAKSVLGALKSRLADLSALGIGEQPDDSDAFTLTPEELVEGYQGENLIGFVPSDLLPPSQQARAETESEDSGGSFAGKGWTNEEVQQIIRENRERHKANGGKAK